MYPGRHFPEQYSIRTGSSVVQFTPSGLTVFIISLIEFSPQGSISTQGVSVSLVVFEVLVSLVVVPLVDVELVLVVDVERVDVLVDEVLVSDVVVGDVVVPLHG
jgi:hypothetical protein